MSMDVLCKSMNPLQFAETGFSLSPCLMTSLRTSVLKP